jgi:helix-turn-helix protein
VSIGEALTRARLAAGLSIADVSRVTRIRETIIRGIEADDYSACGGDFYARGHIRAIARTAGVDSGPLIEEYDASHRPADENDPTQRIAGEYQADRRPPDAIAETDAGAPGAPDAPYGPAAPESPDAPYGPAAPESPDAPYGPAAPESPDAPDAPVTPAARGRRRVNWTAVLGLALVAVAGFGGYLLVSGGGHTSPATSAATAHRAGRSAHPTPSPRPTASRATRSAAPSAPVQALSPVNIAAFGPGGPGQGDNPGLAPAALDGNAAAPWHSDWYTTPHFGNLQPGTGLLLDMGHPVTVTAAQIALGTGAGASVELRVGATPALADLPPAAHRAGAAGTVRLRLPAPASGRYVLVWFTTLPQDPAGTFQASIYRIKVQGHT